jgi:hypothetical protein
MPDLRNNACAAFSAGWYFMVLYSVNIRIAAQTNQPRELLKPIDAPDNIVRLFVADYLAG